MATKVGTINISAIRVPTCSNWSFPPSTFVQDQYYTLSVDVKNNAAVTVDAFISCILRGSSGMEVVLKSGTQSISPSGTKKVTMDMRISDSSFFCDTSWTLKNIGVRIKYGETTYGPYCTQSDRSITLTPNYKGSLVSGHSIPSSAHFGDTITFTIKGKNTNSCFKYNLWAKVTCKLSTDETKQFSGTGSKVGVNAGSTGRLPVTITVPTNIPIGTYNVYADLYAGA